MRAVFGSVLLLLRLVLGGLFVFAAMTKLWLNPPQEFVNSVKAFKIFDPDTAGHLIVMTAFAVPWTELICGLLLIFGFWTRPAALVLSGQLLVFIAAIASVIRRGMSVSCGCFGDYEWPCPHEIGECHMWRNGVLLLTSLILLAGGGGLFSLDRARGRGRRRDVEYGPEPA